MYAGRDFDVIDVNETPILTFDFAQYPLAVGETILGVTWSCAVADFGSATDANPTSRLLGFPGIAGTQVLQQVGTMVAGVKYLLMALVTTNLRQNIDMFSYALCQDPAGFDGPQGSGTGGASGGGIVLIAG